MADTQAKYHHLIPQTYMAAWAHGNGTLYIKYLQSEKIEERNKENIAGINHYHSIVAGMVICTKEDTDILFAPVSSYVVIYEGTVVVDTLELNKIYYDFDNWQISRPDGTPISKKKIESEIDKIKIRDIEENWSVKYENKWNVVRKQIEKIILSAQRDSVPAFQKDYLMKFYTALDWRSIKSNIQFNDAFNWFCKDIMELDDIDIPESERYLKMNSSAADEMRHCLLLKFYRSFLDETGLINKNADANNQHTSFHFLVADGAEYFITSDNPAFIHKREDGGLVGILPITPRILMCQGKMTEDDGNYYITHITDGAVHKYNKAIRENSNEFIILNRI